MVTLLLTGEEVRELIRRSSAADFLFADMIRRAEFDQRKYNDGQYVIKDKDIKDLEVLLRQVIDYLKLKQLTAEDITPPIKGE